jgi:hypothetical protein
MPNENLRKYQSAKLDLIDAEKEEKTSGRILSELTILKGLCAGGDPGSVWMGAGIRPLYEAVYKTAKRAARYLNRTADPIAPADRVIGGQNLSDSPSGDSKADAVSAGVTAALKFYRENSDADGILARCCEVARRTVYKAVRKLQVTDQSPEPNAADDGDEVPVHVLAGERDYRLAGNPRYPDLKAAQQGEDALITAVYWRSQFVKIHQDLHPDDFTFYVQYTENIEPHTSAERKRMERLRERLRERGIVAVPILKIFLEKYVTKHPPSRS